MPPLDTTIIGCTLVLTFAICGTIYAAEKMRAKELKNYNFRKEDEYQRIEDQCDKWYQAYECEHGLRVQAEALVRVQKMILAKTDFPNKTK